MTTQTRQVLEFEDRLEVCLKCGQRCSYRAGTAQVQGTGELVAAWSGVISDSPDLYIHGYICRDCARRDRHRTPDEVAVELKDYSDCWRAAAERRASLLPVTEKDAVRAWATLLEPHFRIEPEVNGLHYSGRKVRMDMLLHPTFEWSGGGHHPIGLEIKKPIHKSGALIGQAADYAASTWSSDAYPDPINVFVAVYDEMAVSNGLAQVLGGIGVAYIGLDEWLGLHIRCSCNRMWSERYGVVNNKWSAQRKFGSR